MGSLRELAEYGAAPFCIWGVVHTIDSLLRHFERRAVLRRTPADQLASVLRALNAAPRDKE